MVFHTQKAIAGLLFRNYDTFILRCQFCAKLFYNHTWFTKNTKNISATVPKMSIEANLSSMSGHCATNSAYVSSMLLRCLWRENIKTFYSTEKPSYNPQPLFPVKVLKFKDIRLKLICSSVVFLLTLNVNTISLNSRFPLTYVNLMWTQSWGILTLGLVNYWLITSSDTGHSQSVSQTLATADRSWTQPCL